MTTTAMADLSERARRVLELQAKASPGPWSAHDGIRQFTMPGKSDPQTVCNCGVIDAKDHAVAYALGAEDEDHTLGEGIGQSGKHYNAAFIAAAHESADLIRELLAENERLRLAAQRYEEVRKWSPVTFANACEVNLKTGKPFDEIVDHLRPFTQAAQSEHPSRDAGPTPLRGRVTRSPE